MRFRTIHESHGQRTIVAILETGDEVTESLLRLSREENITAAQITAIGAFERAGLRYFDWGSKAYEDIPVREQVEVASLLGDIGQDDSGGPALHIHAVLGRRDGTAVAGHLATGLVRPTLEVVLIESPEHLKRRHDPKTGLSLIQIET
ncbi:PPC domain-containing DNA-binding protein [Microvirga massiliensis]|uniref:PPC domain-containing DNA-binding protein n=1 Tax=Microvirga massiliensis TaxID=1033741 RepID=UPI00062B3780|nr:PPC domain-containing DNA-binding protein [Microvirga massiliensis]